MFLIPDKKKLEILLKDMPYFSATITDGFFTPDPLYESFLYFKYDDSEVKGEMALSYAYVSALIAGCGAENLFELKNMKIHVYTPRMESGEIYAIKPIIGMSSEEKFDSTKIKELLEKYKSNNDVLM